MRKKNLLSLFLSVMIFLSYTSFAQETRKSQNSSLDGKIKIEKKVSVKETLKGKKNVSAFLTKNSDNIEVAKKTSKLERKISIKKTLRGKKNVSNVLTKNSDNIEVAKKTSKLERKTFSLKKENFEKKVSVKETLKGKKNVSAFLTKNSNNVEVTKKTSKLERKTFKVSNRNLENKKANKSSLYRDSNNAKKQKTKKTSVSKKNVLNTEEVYFEGFESGMFPPLGWSILDEDDDGINWNGNFNNEQSNTGDYYAGSDSWTGTDGALNPDNWLITPLLDLSETNELTFWVAGFEATYFAEQYSVMLSTTGTNVADFTDVLHNETLTDDIWKEVTVDLSDYSGEIYIAFRHHDTYDVNMLKLDDITMPKMSANQPATVVLPIDNYNFGTVTANTENSFILNYSMMGIESFDISVDAPFSAVIGEENSVEIFFNPTEVGNFESTLTFNIDGEFNGANTVELSGNSIAEGYTFESFENGFPIGWSTINNNEEIENSWNIDNSGGFSHEGMAACYSLSSDGAETPEALNPDNWLITPRLMPDATNNEMTFWVSTFFADMPNAHYEVLVSTGGNEVADFTTELINADLTDSIWAQVTVDLSDYNDQDIYVAIRHYMPENDGAEDFAFIVDEIVLPLSPNQVPEIVLGEEEYNFGVSEENSENSFWLFFGNFGLGDLNVSGVTVDAPFSATYTGAAILETNDIDSVEVFFNPTAVGDFVSTLTFNIDGEFEGINTLVLSGSVLSDDVYFEDFEGDFFPPLGWSILDEDGDANEWFSYDVDETAHSGTYSAVSASWLNGDVLTPDNWLITPKLTLTEENNAISFWVAAQDAGFPDENYSVLISTTDTEVESFTEIYTALSTGEWEEVNVDIDLSTYPAGDIYIAFRHHNCTDQFYLKLDDIIMPELSENQASNIMVGPEDYNFGSVDADSESSFWLFFGSFGLSDLNITGVTVDAPFSASYNANTLEAGDIDSVEVFFNPTDIGDFAATLTINVDGEFEGTNTVALSGNVLSDAIYFEDFEGDFFPPLGWSILDEDGDANEWFSYDVDETAHSGTYSAVSASWLNGDVLTPDNWLITPKLTLTEENNAISFWVAAQDAGFPDENYSVLISTTDTEVESFTEIYTALSTGEWEEVNVDIDLSTYPAGDIYIAFRHHNCTDQFYLKLDDIIMPELSENQASNIMVGPEDYNFGSVDADSESSFWLFFGSFGLSDLNITGVTVDAPFSASYNANTLEAGDIDSVEVFFNPTTSGDFTATLTINIDGEFNGTNTVALSGNVLVEGVILEDFEGELFPPLGWSMVDNDDDGNIWFSYSVEGTAHEGLNSAGSAGALAMDQIFTPDDWLITPRLAPTNEISQFSFWVDAQDENYAAHYYEVLVSTTGNSPEDFETTPLSSETLTNNTEWHNIVVDLSDYVGQNIYIAIRHYIPSHPEVAAFIVKIDDVAMPPLSEDQTPSIVMASEMNFGTFSVNDGPQDFELEIVNSGMGDLIITGVNVDAPFIVPTSNFPLTIEPGNIETISLSFIPETGGNFESNLELIIDGEYGGNNTTTLYISVLGADVLFFEDFETTEAGELPTGWLSSDEDGDGYDWGTFAEYDGSYSGTSVMMSASYINDVGALTPDNWIITPQITLDENVYSLNYFVKGVDPNYAAENYSVLISTTGTNTSDFTEIFTEVSSGDWQENNLSLATYSDEQIYIAFRHHNVTDMYYLCLDLVTISTLAEGSVCGNAISLDLPQDNLEGTTEGFGNDYSDPECGTPSFMNGYDIVYEVTVEDGKYLAGSLSSTDYASIFVYNDCPENDGACIGFEKTNAQNPTVNFDFLDATNGTYYLIISSNSSATNPTSADFTLSLRGEHVGIDDLNSNNSIKMYPNPNNGEFNIVLNSKIEKDYTIELVNVQGQVVFTKSLNNVTTHKEEVNISSLGAGVYYLRTNDGENIHIEKVIVK